MSVNVTVFKLEDKLTFGKYKGKLLKEVLAIDSGYLQWAHGNIDWFDMDKEALDAMCDVAMAAKGIGVMKVPANKKEVTPQPKQPPLFDNYDGDDNGVPF